MLFTVFAPSVPQYALRGLTQKTLDDLLNLRLLPS